ncbi:heme-binding protein [Variovorax paradoxus]|nr:heme-binding protein [Variovorax paradoxus]
MRHVPEIESADARRVLDAALAFAQSKGWPVGIAVVDAGGNPFAMQRLDGAPAPTARIAMSKARTAALSRRESKHYEDVINGGRPAFLSAPGLDGMLEGGVPILIDGITVGAVGVSGVLPSQDVEIARTGIAALGS